MQLHKSWKASIKISLSSSFTPPEQFSV